MACEIFHWIFALAIWFQSQKQIRNLKIRPNSQSLHMGGHLMICFSVKEERILSSLMVTHSCWGMIGREPCPECVFHFNFTVVPVNTRHTVSWPRSHNKKIIDLERDSRKLFPKTQHLTIASSFLSLR